MVLNIEAKNSKKTYFKGNNSYKDSFHNFDSVRYFVGLVMRIISTNESFFISFTVFKIEAKHSKKCLSRAITLIRSHFTTLTLLDIL